MKDFKDSFNGKKQGRGGKMFTKQKFVCLSYIKLLRNSSPPPMRFLVKKKKKRLI